jgi:hypothetical protein
VFGKIQVPKNVQHMLVLALYERVEEPNPVTSRFLDQPRVKLAPTSWPCHLSSTSA